MTNISVLEGQSDLQQTLNTQTGLHPTFTALNIVQLAGSLQASTALQSDNSVQSQEYLSLQAESMSCQMELTKLTNEMDTSTPQNALGTVGALNLAMTVIYKLAVFIRGDYDTRTKDLDQRKSLLAQTVEAFLTVKESAEKGLWDLSAIHVQLTEIRSARIIPLRAKVRDLAEASQRELEELRHNIEETNRAVEILQRGYDVAAANVTALEEKQRNTTIVATGVVAGILSIFAPVLAIPAGSALAQLLYDLTDARNTLKSTERTLEETRNNLNKARHQQMKLQNQELTSKVVESGLPTLESGVVLAISRASLIESQLIVLKDTSAKLLLQVRDVENKATVTTALVYTKEEFALGLLGVCESALIDQRLITEVNYVRNEIIGGYFDRAPTTIVSSASSLKAKVAALAG